MCPDNPTDTDQPETSCTNDAYVVAPEPNNGQQPAYSSQLPNTPAPAVSVFSLASNSYTLMQLQPNWYGEKPMVAASLYPVEGNDRTAFAHTDQQPTAKQLYKAGLKSFTS